jgi:F-type H+-transporting ATPase subunit a
MYNGSILKSNFFNITFICAFFLTIGAFPARVFSQENKPAVKEEKFDAGKATMEHIADKHEWHLLGEKFIPLPVLLYTDKGFETFSSGRLQPQGTVYKGRYYNYMLVNNKIKVADETGKIDEAANKKVWDFSITQNVAGMWLSGLVLLFVFLSIYSSYKKTVGKAP